MPNARSTCLRYTFVVSLALLGACGEAADPGDGGGMDGAVDGGASADDAGQTTDSAGSDDGGQVDSGLDADIDLDGGVDACAPPECPAPPAGCEWVGDDPCACGTLVCPDAGLDAGTDAGCTAPTCPTPEVGCSWVGGGPCDCGTLECDCGIHPCDPAEFCDYDAALACGGSGRCTPRPVTCPGGGELVCGCDGVTHINVCEAHAAGTDIASESACPGPGGDCRTEGCPSGNHCVVCRGAGWICLPHGTGC